MANFRAGYDIPTIPIKSRRTLKILLQETNHKREIYIRDLSITIVEDIDLNASYSYLVNREIVGWRSAVFQDSMYVGDIGNQFKVKSNSYS